MINYKINQDLFYNKINKRIKMKDIKIKYKILKKLL